MPKPLSGIWLLSEIIDNACSNAADNALIASTIHGASACWISLKSFLGRDQGRRTSISGPRHSFEATIAGSGFAQAISNCHDQADNCLG
jgi:hypothetical protein